MGRLTRTSASEKYELIRLVEESALPVKQTLAEIGLPRSTFYRWYAQYQRDGLEDCRITRANRISSGTASPRPCVSRWCRLPCNDLNCRHEN